MDAVQLRKQLEIGRAARNKLIKVLIFSFVIFFGGGLCKYLNI